MRHIFYCILAVFITISLEAQTIGSDYGGADFSPSNGEILQGTFTNIGNFTIPVGVTVYVDPGFLLTINAQNILIDGVLNGDAAGQPGGGFVSPGNDGLPGSGAGGGCGGFFGGNVHGNGGCGGAYGGNGGNGAMSACCGNPIAQTGPLAYGDASSPGIQMGSGGGSAPNHGCCGAENLQGLGGNGGGAISLIATTSLDISGTVSANGEEGGQGQQDAINGYNGACGGGGSGGGIELSAPIGAITGSITANGGNGRDNIGPPASQYPQPSGGGGGGRIKVFGSVTISPTSLSANGGIAGTNQFGSLSTTVATAGDSGSLFGGNIVSAVPAMGEWALIILALFLMIFAIQSLYSKKSKSLRLNS
jgi:hypothetical protein